MGRDYLICCVATAWIGSCILGGRFCSVHKYCRVYSLRLIAAIRDARADGRSSIG